MDPLLKVEINWWLIEGLVTKWDVVDWVVRFGTIDLYLTIDEHSRILGIQYNTGSIVTPPLN